MTARPVNSFPAPLWLLPLTYALWCLVNLAVLAAGDLAIDRESPPLVLSLSVLFFVLLASSATAAFAIYLEPVFRGARALRIGFLLATLVIGCGLYLYSSQAGPAPAWAACFGSANLLVAAMLLGTWMVEALKRPAELVLVCVVMSLADLFSVLKGPTREIVQGLESYYHSGMKGPAPIGEYLLVKVAVPGFSLPVPVFGVADWVIVAFLSSASMKFGMNDNLAGTSLTAMAQGKKPGLFFPVGALGLLLAMLLAQGFNLPLPALPIMAAVFLTFILTRYPRARNLAGSDWYILLGASGLLAGLIALPL